MVPMFVSSSSRVMPMPLSSIRSVLASLSTNNLIRNSGSSLMRSLSDNALKRSRSIASEPLLINSRRKMSLFE